MGGLFLSLFSLGVWAGGNIPFGVFSPNRADLDISLVSDGRDSADRTTYTFSSLSFGAAHERRALLVAVMNSRSAPIDDPTTVTIGGVNAIKVHGWGYSASGNVHASLWMAVIPTGTSGSVVVNHASTQMITGIAVFRAVNLHQGVVTDSAVVTGTTLSVGSQKGGAIIGVANNSNNNNHTWSGIPEVSDANIGNGRLSFALKSYSTAVSSQSATVTNAGVVWLFAVR